MGHISENIKIKTEFQSLYLLPVFVPKLFSFLLDAFLSPETLCKRMYL